MRRPSPRPALLLAALCLLSLPAVSSAAAQAGATTVIVVRHAERASESDRDSPLSEAGTQRALALRDALADAGVSAVYSTHYRRTRHTVQPLAEELGLPVQVDTMSSVEAYAAEVARRVAERHAGEVVLVVGHSNTVPDIVHALGGPDLPDLDSADYDNLFVVTVLPDGTARTIRARFGAPDGVG